MKGKRALFKAIISIRMDGRRILKTQKNSNKLEKNSNKLEKNSNKNHKKQKVLYLK
jgi:hypothetical protein